MKAAQELSLAFSPCPNDTFCFHAMLHGYVNTTPLAFRTHIADVEELNQNAAMDGAFDVTKLSYHAWLLLKDRYDLLDAGSALGYGCGPLLVARDDLPRLEDATIAVPGSFTTALLLFRLFCPSSTNFIPMRFDRIMPAVSSGEVDAGLVIHEGRFVYPRYGLHKIVDLGEWWEETTDCPIPLGCIAINKRARRWRDRTEVIIRDSIRYGVEHRRTSRNFIKQHARELEDEVIDAHIGLYVNEFSISLGDTGKNAIATLEDMARSKGVID